MTDCSEGGQKMDKISERLVKLMLMDLVDKGLLTTEEADLAEAEYFRKDNTPGEGPGGVRAA